MDIHVVMETQPTIVPDAVVGRTIGNDLLRHKLGEGGMGSAYSADQHGALLRPDRAMAIALQIADVLSTSHREGIVHCDLRRDNLIPMSRGRAHDFTRFRRHLDKRADNPINEWASASTQSWWRLVITARRRGLELISSDRRSSWLRTGRAVSKRNYVQRCTRSNREEPS
jgi:serine/threonine protein kinase